MPKQTAHKKNEVTFCFARESTALSKTNKKIKMKKFGTSYNPGQGFVVEKEFQNTNLSIFGLSQNTIVSLYSVGIETLGDLQGWKKEYLLSMKTVGKSTIEELEKVLEL